MDNTIRISRRLGLGVASIHAFKGVDAGAIGDAIECAAPSGPARTTNGQLALVGTGPGAWLAVAEDPAPDWAVTLSDRLETIAAVSDQSAGYAILRLAGPDARRLLQRGAPVDLHPDAFPCGSCAVTVIAHIGVLIWQVDDQPAYEIACFSSYAASLERWVALASAAL